jgi:hypothetical protein
MFDVWVLDFVGNERALIESSLSLKRANKLRKKLQKQDPYSLFIVVPLGFSL